MDLSALKLLCGVFWMVSSDSSGPICSSLKLPRVTMTGSRGPQQVGGVCQGVAGAKSLPVKCDALQSLLLFLFCSWVTVLVCVGSSPGSSRMGGCLVLFQSWVGSWAGAWCCPQWC